ncbi:myosin light chain kinase, smooth muscle-like isoform X1 [Tigriopus californicus]|uniref:myosin light chain kinase, smooth muscle-like isoform X1 n=1 Tax=Tigriopus californicus TaxID=6832 RepID=UPI0027DA834D|nr:myosin light chain kinase, smooth muscle-like isoform X1 [Tigriopus californicus]
MSIQSTTQKIQITDKGLDATTIKKLPGPPEFTQELNMRQETDGVLLECFLIYEPEHEATWFKEGRPLLGGLDYDERYQPFLERRGDWTYCALAIRHLCNDDAGNYSVTVRNKYGDKTNHVRLSMKDPNEPQKIPGGIEPAFFRKPSSRQEGNKLHLECEIEALPPPEIKWFRNEQEILPNERYTFHRGVTHGNPNIHFVRLTVLDPSTADGGNYIVRARNAMGEKDCTLALNFGGPSDNEENVPAKIYEQPELKQPDPSVLILEAHIHANPPPKISWLRNGDFIKESDRVQSRIEPRQGEMNKFNAILTITRPNSNDAGDYKLSIKNKWGTDYTTWVLG